MKHHSSHRIWTPYGDGGYNDFSYKPFHAKSYEMFAGQAIEVMSKVYFDPNDLLPSDYSVVVWAEKQEVNMTSQGSDVNSPFPFFELDKSIKQYNWKG